MSKLFNRIIKSNKLEYILLSIILVLGFVVRLYKINNPIADWHSWRQADTASVTRTYVEKGINLLYPRYHDISSIQSRIFNPNGYRFVEFPVYNSVHALLVIYFGRVILPEPMATSFGLLAIWLFIKFFDSDKSVFLYSSAASLSLAILIKPFTLFYAAPIFYLAWIKPSKPKILYLACLSIVMVPFLAWRAWIGRYPEGIPLTAWAFNGDRIRFRPSFWRWIFGERLGMCIRGGWGLIPFVFGIIKARKETYFNLSFLLGMFLYVLVFATANVKHDYYQTFIIPAVSLTLAAGSLELWKAERLNKFISRGLLIFSVFLMLLTGAMDIKGNFVVNHPNIIQEHKTVAELPPQDALVVAPYNGDTAFLYQPKRWGWPAM